jgi:hypothetical protein
MLALYAAVVAVLLAVTWLVLDVPESYSDEAAEPPGHDAEVEGFAHAAIPLHAAAALVLLATLWAWSARRRAGGPGGATALAISAACAYLALMLAWNDAYWPLALAAFWVGLGTLPVVPLAALVSAAAFRVRGRRLSEAGRFRAVAALGWYLLLVALPFHLDVALFQGTSID